jgi:RND family efflux transporter MFP subunit
MKKILIIAIAAALLSACAGTSSVENEEAKRQELQQYKKEMYELEQKIAALEAELESNEKVEIIPVKTQEIQIDTFEHFIEVTGQVEAEQDVNVSPETAGVIEQVFITEGQYVSKGKILARLNSDILDRSLDEINVQLDLATTNYERQKNLWDQNIGSEMQFLQAKNNKESLEKRIKSIQAQIEMAQVKSPINGTVDVVYQKKGNIGSPQVPFARIININKIKIYADVSESYITKFKKGDKVSVDFPALNKTVKIPIFQVGNSIDPNNRTFRIRLNMNNINKEIKPNLVSIIRLRDYVNEEAIVIPALFIKEDFQGRYTYIANKDGGKNVAKKIYIETGVTDNNLTEVTEGLEPGMQIISEGYNQVVDGTVIQY